MSHSLGDLLRPRMGWIIVEHGPDRNVEQGFSSIEVTFEPFLLPADVAHEWGLSADAPVETRLQLDFITWPVPEQPVTLSALTGQQLAFAINPDEGYIDGSVHLLGEHRHADVTRIDFGDVIDDAAIDAVLTVHVDAQGTGLEDLREKLGVRLVEIPRRPD